MLDFYKCYVMYNYVYLTVKWLGNSIMNAIHCMYSIRQHIVELGVRLETAGPSPWTMVDTVV